VSPEDLVGETTDPHGERVVLLERIWQSKVLRDHPEMRNHESDLLRAVKEPTNVEPDPVYENRTRYYARDLGPSRWLLAIVSYEQEPARIVSAFGVRKDPRSWSG
jgi:hypothetical protein